MILSRQKFDMNGKTIIEKVVIHPPFRYETLFQDEGCFLHVSGSPATFNSPNQTVQIKSEESVLLKCGSYFVDYLKKSTESYCVVYAIHLYPEVLKALYINELPSYILPKDKGSFIQKVVPDITLTRFIDGLDFYFETPALVNEELLKLKIKELILILVQTKNAQSVIQLISDLFTPHKTPIKEVISNHLYSNLSVDKLAELSNMSVSTFKRNFHKIYKDTPLNYINSKRMERAKELLLFPGATVADVAFELGYADPAYFSRLFKKYFHIAPSHYANQV